MECASTCGLLWIDFSQRVVDADLHRAPVPHRALQEHEHGHEDDRPQDDGCVVPTAPGAAVGLFLLWLL